MAGSALIGFQNLFLSSCKKEERTNAGEGRSSCDRIADDKGRRSRLWLCCCMWRSSADGAVDASLPAVPHAAT